MRTHRLANEPIVKPITAPPAAPNTPPTNPNAVVAISAVVRMVALLRMDKARVPKRTKAGAS